jgi:hypothetical protein
VVMALFEALEELRKPTENLNQESHYLSKI